MSFFNRMIRNKANFGVQPVLGKRGRGKKKDKRDKKSKTNLDISFRRKVETDKQLIRWVDNDTS